MKSFCRFLLLIIGCNALQAADDWPMWRFDAGRTAASNMSKIEKPSLIWTRQYGPRKPAWDDPLNMDLMSYDRVFEPIVADGRLFVGFNDIDQLRALDAATGEELWSYTVGGPVRLAPVAWKGRVYFVSDDGYLYCLDAKDGTLQWKFRGGPDDRQAIGNTRLISAWPARGGPVIRDGNVYFASSIWPFMGIYIYALDAQSGNVLWINDDSGSQYIKQPHSAPSFAGVAPQGSLVATEKMLLVSGGRSVPAAFDRQTGKFLYYEVNAAGKGTGGSFVIADEESYYVHTRLKGTREFELETGVKTAFLPNEPVLTKDRIYSAIEEKGKKFIRAYDKKKELDWELECDGSGDLIVAGDRLYAAGKNHLSAIDLPRDDQLASIAWQIPVDGQVERLLAADGKLFAVTLDGRIMAFGKANGESRAWQQEHRELTSSPTGRQRARALLASHDAQGYGVWIGDCQHEVVEALAVQSPFVQLSIIDRDVIRVEKQRADFQKAGVYGRVTIQGDLDDFIRLPPYVMHGIYVDESMASSLVDEPTRFKRIYESVRPYGGCLHLLANPQQATAFTSRIKSIELEQADVSIGEHGVIVRRVGPLPGAADWTHQYGNVSNTLKSNDSRVKLPLGILWFGGNSNADILPRHGHGPPEQVVGGRLFIQGMNSLSARDVYTGRVLWKRTFDNLGTDGIYFDDTYKDKPLDPAYNQVHIPGANGRGTNYVVADNHVYLIEGSLCHVLDASSGETVLDIAMPQDDPEHPKDWAYIGVYEDVLLGGAGFANFRTQHAIPTEKPATTADKKKVLFGLNSLDRSASQGLVAFDRRTGKQLWSVKADYSFWHNGIVAGGGRVYALDKNPQPVEDLLKRRGKAIPNTYRILALDHRTGRMLWESKERIFGTWLGYSEEHDLLLQAGASASDRVSAEVGQGIAVHSASDGSIRWKNDSLKYSGPCILHHETIITNANSYTESAGAFNLLNGKPQLILNPITGQMQPWKILRTYGCNNIIASENLLTFRSGAAGVYDLLSHCGTGNLGGFKSGCTSNLVVADGVLNAPDYTRTCSCAYQNQTSLALVHSPELDVWSVNTRSLLPSVDDKIKNLGVNFGAPGDRSDPTGLLWIEFPESAGETSPISIQMEGNVRTYQDLSSRIVGGELPWVMSSGVEGVRTIRLEMRRSADKGSAAGGVMVNHPEDDAEEDAKGKMDLKSSDLELVDDGGDQLIGIRFASLAMERGTKIKAAYLQLTCDEATKKPTHLDLFVEDSSDAKRFTAKEKDISSRRRSSQSIRWSPKPWDKVDQADVDQRSPDLAPLIQSIIDRDDWASGKSIALIIQGKGKRVAKAATGKNKVGPRLILETEAADVEKSTSRPTVEQRYRLRLFFAPPDRENPVRRVFSVRLQGQRAIEDLVLDSSVLSTSPGLVKTVENISIGEMLEIQFEPQIGEPILSGLELRKME